jgi:hypothetical protein
MSDLLIRHIRFSFKSLQSVFSSGEGFIPEDRLPGARVLCLLITGTHGEKQTTNGWISFF